MTLKFLIVSDARFCFDFVRKYEFDSCEVFHSTRAVTEIYD